MTGLHKWQQLVVPAFFYLFMAGMCARFGLEIGVILLVVLAIILGQWIVTKIGIESLLIFTAPIHRIYLNIGFALKPFYIIVILVFVGHFLAHRPPLLALKVNRTFKLVLIFLGTLFVATLINGAHVVSLRHLMLMCFVFIGSWIVLNRIRTFEDIHRISDIYLHTGFIHALIGISLYVLFFIKPGLCGEGSIFEGVTYDFDHPWSWPMLQSVDVGSNGYGMSLLPFLFVAVSAFYYAKTFRKKLYVALVFILLLTNLFLTFSRGGMVAFFISGVLMLITVKASKKWKIILITVFFVLVVAFTPKIIELYKAYSFLKGAYSGEGSDLMSARGELFMASLEVFLKNPLFGIGQGTIADSAVGKQSHNTYIELLAENGIFAFTVFAAFIGIVFKKSWVALRKLKQGEEYYLVYSFVIGLVALLIASIPTSAITMTLLWLQFAIIIGCLRATASSSTIIRVPDASR